MAAISTREIRNRIRSMESTRQITKAMELVAASNLRKAQERIRNSRPYFQILCNTMNSIVNSNRDFTSPYLTQRSENRVMYIVIAGDRGLAGGYNSSILKLVENQIRDRNAIVLPIGKKAVDFFRSRKIPVLTESYAEVSDVSTGDCFSIAKQLSNAYLAGEFDEIYVAYTNFISVLSQIPVSFRMLPLQRTEAPRGEIVKSGILYEPDDAEFFDAVVPEYLGGILYGALRESQAAEAAARRSAMDNATRNTDDMIADLSLKFNRARQAAITQEITEIVAGS